MMGRLKRFVALLPGVLTGAALGFAALALQHENFERALFFLVAAACVFALTILEHTVRGPRARQPKRGEQ